MQNALLWAAGGTGFTFLMTALGASMVFFFRKKVSNNIQRIFLGFAAGVMVAASVWSLLIPAIEEASERGWPGWLPAAGGLALGVAFLILMDSLLPHLHLGESKPEGLSSSWKRTTLLVFAVTLHNIPEGISVAMPVWYATGSRRRAFRCTLLSGLTEPVGAVLAFALLRPFLNGLLLGVLFGAVAGIMVYIAVEELIPSSRQYGHDRPALWATLCGICVMPLTHLFQT